MKPKARWSSVWCFILLACALSGCTGKISTEAKALLATSALAAKERAVAFAAISTQVKAAKPDDQKAVDRWAGAHAEGLASQAKALADLHEAVQLGSLNKQTVKQIGGMAETARARAENFRGMTPLIAWNWPAFVESHQAALDLQAQQLAALHEKLKPKDEKQQQ